VAVLVYPVISLEPPFGHMGSRNNLLGKEPDPKLVESFSNEKQVTDQTPPMYLVHSSDDKVVPIENSLQFAMQLSKAQDPLRDARLRPRRARVRHGQQGPGAEHPGSKAALSGWSIGGSFKTTAVSSK